MRHIVILLIVFVCSIITSCADHDDPQLAPIETTKVKISAMIKDSPKTPWLNISEELTISVSNVEMTAPKGVVLRSISLVANNGSVKYTIDDKPFSGEPMEFKVPLTVLRGRVNFSVRGNLIKKDSRDAEVIIADNIQKIVFSESPEFECQGRLNVSVKSKSSSGEEYSRSFEVTSTEIFTIPISKRELYWQPSSGTATTLEVSLSGGASAKSPNTTFDCKISKTAIGSSPEDGATAKFSIQNTPGSLNSMKLQMYVIATYFGTWENVSIEPYNINNVFSIVESD